jgi:trigger factor
MLLEKVAEKEKVEVTQDEIDDELGKMAEYYRTTADEIRKTFEKQGSLDNIKNNLRTRKAIEALISKAKVTDGPWVDEHAEPAVEAEKTEKKKPAKKAAKKTETAETDEPVKKEAKKKTAKTEA